MKKHIFTLVFIALTGLLVSQSLSHECGNQKIDSIRKSIDPEYNSKVLQLNNEINDYINANYKNNSSNQNLLAVSPTAQYIIPVVVHIVLDPSNPINNSTISYQQVQSQIDALNAAFAKGYSTTYNNGQTHGPNAVDTKIQFCLAQNPIGITNWPISSEPGVMRYNDAAKSQNQLTIGSTNTLINFTNGGGKFPFNQFFNIWVVNSIDGNCSGVQGYAINPLGPQYGQTNFSIDGVVIRADAFGDNSISPNNFNLQPHNLYPSCSITSFAQRNQGKVLVHEVGHYLNLWHTFQNDIVTGATCAGSTPGTCNSEGDFCCDTPPSNVSSTFICGSPIPTSCGPMPDMVENYMYYATDPCYNTFTLEQKNRMWSYLNLFRSELFSQNNQIATGLIGSSGCIGQKLLANFSINPNPPCINTAVTFNPIGSSANTAVSWSWSFSGGSISSSTAQYPVVTFAAPGNYNVSLTVTDIGGNVNTHTQIITVGACILNPSYIHNNQWYFGHYAGIDFSSGSPAPNNAAAVFQTIDGNEGAYSYSDNNGNVVFYTDGIDLWNSAHQQINTIRLFPSIATQGSSYGVSGVPLPGQANKYIIFCSPAFEDFGNSFDFVRYVILDLTAGTISPAQNLSTVLMSEVLTIAPHCNGVDYWLIVHDRVVGSNKFYSYLISGLGLNINPIMSAANTFKVKAGCQMSLSPNCQNIVIAGGVAGNSVTNDIALYDFNNSTGLVTNERMFDSPTNNSDGNTTFTGCSFSANSQQIYAVDYQTQAIYQFDFSGTCTPIINNYRVQYMLLGPDNEIYCHQWMSNKIDKISSPNTPVNIGSFQQAVVNFSSITPAGIHARAAMPNLIVGIMPPATNPTFSYVYTSCSNVNFTMNSCWGGYVYTWNFGDGTPTVTGATVTHNYTIAGPYNVICTLTVPGLSGSIATQPQVINILNSTTPITGPINVCLTNNTPYIYSVPFVNGATYNWSISSNGTILGASNGSQINVQWNSGTTGNISVVITNGGCTSNGSLNITLLPLPVITAVASPATVCSTSPNSVLTAAGASSYVWNPGSIVGNPITVNPTNTTVYNVIGTDLNKCSNSANVTVTYGTCVTSCPACLKVIGVAPGQFPNANTDSYCINSDYTIVGTKIFSNSDIRIASGVKIIVPSGANLIITHSHLYACLDMWKGIEVQPGGKVSVLNNSLIEDAITAIEIKNSTLTANLLRLINSTFNRNYKSVYIENYSPVLPNYPFKIEGCVFTSRSIYVNPLTPLTWPNTNVISATAANAGAPLSSDIISDLNYPSNTTGALLKNPYPLQKSQIGIELVKVGSTQGTEASPIYYEFTLGANGPTKTNVFDNIRYEVNLVNSNLNSINNIYQNTSFVNRANGGVGINAFCDQTLNGRLKVTKVGNFKNKFIDCGTAIQTIDYFVHEITDNEIRSSKVNNAPNPPISYLGVYGVNITTNRYYNCSVNNNSLFNIETGVVFTLRNAAYDIYGNVGFGQYVKELNINFNTISSNFIGSSVTSQYIKDAIVLQNITFDGKDLITRAPNLLSVNNNSLVAVYRGISISSFGKTFQKINNNVIGLVPDVFVTNNVEYGISFTNNKAYQASSYNKADNNTITGYGITNPKNSGILFNSSSGLTLGCNVVDNTYNGLHFNGANFANAVYKNEMQNNQYGFVLNNNAIVGQDYAPNYFDIAIGEPNLPADNVWNGTTWTGGKTKTRTEFSSAINSPMYVRNMSLQYDPDLSASSNPPNPLNEYHNSNGSLPYTTGATPAVCTVGVPATAPPNSNHGLLSKIAQNQVPLLGDISQTHRVQKNQVFLMLKEDPTLMATSPVLQNFYTTNVTTNSETFYNVEQHLAKNELTLASNDLASVSVQDAVDVSYKTFNQSLLNYQQGVFNAADSAALYQLSNKCPYTDGLVIFQARVLYNLALNVVETFQDNCTIPSSARFANTLNKNEQEAIYNVELFPNPTSNNFVISTLTESSRLKIEIMDVQGKLISSEIKDVSNYSAKVVTDLNNGVYFVNIIDVDSGLKTIKKLVIQK